MAVASVAVVDEPAAVEVEPDEPDVDEPDELEPDEPEPDDVEPDDVFAPDDDPVVDVDPVADAESSVGGGATYAIARTSSEILRSKARANCDFSISSRPLAVSFHD